MPLVLDGTNGVSGVDGTASNPSYEGTDSNTGIFFPAADTVAIGTGGTEALRVNSAQNMGLGATPSTWTIFKALEVGAAGTGLAGAAGQPVLFSNCYFNAGWKYAANGFAANYDQINGQHRWFNVASGTANANITFTQAMTLDASGDLGVGITSPTSRLHLKGPAGSNPNTNGVVFQYSASTANFGAIGLDNASGDFVIAAGSGASTRFYTNSDLATTNERMRITSGGDLLVGKTSGTITTAGAPVYFGALSATRDAEVVATINRLTNDGGLVSFRQDSTEEGSISVSGTTVSYNGGHLARYSQLLSGQRDESIVKGTVLSNLDEMCEWTDAEGNPLPNEQLNRMKVSDVEGDTNVAGVFVNWDNDDQDNPYDMNIAMTGDMIIRIAQGVTVQKGDLLMSAGDGTAKPQGDDIVRSKTVAKVTSNHVTCTYDDGSYCVPCVLMAC
jgi:hypothetical protein